MSPREVLMIFARAPEPGRSKTRLIPALGASGAAEFQRACLLDVCERHAGRGREVVVWRAGRADHPVWGEVGCPIRAQPEGDLGERMAAAFAHELRRAPRVVILGTDSPTLAPERVDRAFAALGRVELVLGPALDGGYYLLGARDRVPPVFRGPAWGGERVLRDTIAQALAAGLRYELLEAGLDVDRPEDLPRLRDELTALARSGGEVPRRIAALLGTLP